MKNNRVILFFVMTFLVRSLYPTINAIPGESLWCISKQIAGSLDRIESAISVLSVAVSFDDYLVSSSLSVLMSKLALVIPSQLEDFASQADSFLSRAEIAESFFEITASKAAIISSEIDLLTLCEPQSITVSTTINTPGSYCLCCNVAIVRISANNVVLDLRGNTITSSLTIDGNDQILVENGAVAGGGVNDAVTISPGASNITVSRITVRNGIRGIYGNNVLSGCIESCQMVSNITGIELISSTNVCIDHCTSFSTMYAGFSLISSSTNTLTSCKSLSAGLGNNTVRTNNIYGFVAQNSSSNIFENCIANATQALSTTDYNSIVAGFALAGTSNYNKIIGCEAANAVTSASGVTVPYGIWLQSNVSSSLTLTAVPAIPVPGDGVKSVTWSPDRLYIAAGIAANDTQRLRIYALNTVSNTMSQVASASPGDVVNAVDWRQDGMYVATGLGSSDTYKIRIYNFNYFNNTLSLIAVPDVVPTASVSSVRWSPNGIFLAVGVGGGTTAQVRIYKFDDIAGSLTQYATATIGATTNIASVEWSPDGLYLGVCDQTSVRTYIYAFNQGSASLTQSVVLVQTAPLGIKWSADGNYIVVADTTTLRVYRVRYGTGISVTQVATTSALALAVDWSADGQYIVVGLNSNPSVNAYRFDRGNNTLSLVSNANINTGAAVQTVRWSPDGRYVVAGAGSGDVNRLLLYSALSFPSDNVIKDNTVYCNSGAQYPSGVGISGSSICNYMVGNTAYSNSVNPPIVPTNYQFICNVFNPLFQNASTLLQNIALGSCESIPTPNNTPLLIDQALYTVAQDASFLATIQTAFDTILSTTYGCTPAFIYTPTTITVSGVYCLTKNISGSIVINQSDVIVDLNNFVVTGTVSITSKNRVTVRHGTIDANNTNSFAIDVQSGSRDVTISDVYVRNATRGISLNNVVDAYITRCEMVNNTTGLEAISSYGVHVDSSIARANTNAGFSLITSYTSIIKDSKALSTGLRNTQQSGVNVFGFYALNGTSNIFEDCIANATQALSTTDFNSVVAGFALSGSAAAYTKIINCEAANGATGSQGYSVPYGILLQNSLSSITSITAQATGGASDSVRALAWSSDNTYLAVGGTLTGNDLLILQYAPLSSYSILTKVQSIDFGTTSTVFSVSWSPLNNLIAVCGDFTGDDLRVLSFETANQTISQMASIASGSQSDVFYTVAWSPDSKYIAAGGALATTDFRVYFYDSVGINLTQLASQSTGSVSDSVQAVAWSPDGLYIAVGGTISGNTIQVYSFTPSPGSVALAAFASISSGTVQSLAWSPDGLYLACGGTLSTNSLQIYQFTRSPSPSLSLKVQILTGANVYGVAWSSDGAFLAVSGNASGSTLLVYAFDRSLNALNLQQSVGSSQTNVGTVNALVWSPDGRTLSVGGVATGSFSYDFTVLRALSFPSDNVIMDNVVYDNSGGVNQRGIGISGSSTCNAILQNTSYANPANPPVVATNYAYVCNVFSEAFSSGPTYMQNISLAPCQPIATPDNIALLIKQAQAQIVADMSILAASSSILALSSPCSATSITSMTGTTITASGLYCLGVEMTGAIQINANEVTLNLNNHTVTGSITVNAVTQVVINNGTIVGSGSSDGITVAVGARDISIKDVVIQSAIRGINFSGVTSGLIERCELVQNVTGIVLTQSSNIVIDKTVAYSNTLAGFSLILSNTNTIQNCQALSTGEGNSAVLTNNVYGFVSQNGFSNIFENCIANATQALSTTDYNSIVAGFALTGTENGTKIIGCEAANAITNAAGVTVPYGIWLQSTLSNFSSVTYVNPGGGAVGDTVRYVSWSSDGLYLAAGGSINSGVADAVYIYKFDRTALSLTQVASANPAGGGQADSVEATVWSPDGRYLAVVCDNYSSDNKFIIYYFDRFNNSLTQIVSTSPFNAATDSLFMAAWSPDQQYIAVSGSVSNSAAVYLYMFNAVAQTVSLVTSLSPAGAATSTASEIITWSPDGRYFVVGVNNASVFLRLYVFNSSVSGFVLTDSLSGGAPDIYIAQFSPDGQYLAIAGDPTALSIYTINRATNKFVFVTALNTAVATPGLSWSPDGQYIAIGTDQNPHGAVYRFDRGAGRLIQVGQLTGTGPTEFVAWSPDGRYIAAGGSFDTPNTYDLVLYSALNFPSDNVIKDNTVYCNSGARFPSGAGISGSSICNYMVGNTAYSNPNNPSIASTNYQFVCNVFNSLFQSAPAVVQNNALGSCDPIGLPPDLITLLVQANQLVSGLGECSSTAITQSQSTTLSISSNYCLANSITADVVITGTSIFFDLNNECVTGRITIQTSDDVLVANGSVKPVAPVNSGDAAISAVNVASTARYCVLRNVRITCADTTVAAVSGRSGISIAGGNTQVLNCSVISGGVTASASATPGTGGDAIIVTGTATQTLIRDSLIMNTGSGGLASAGNTGGRAGHGFLVQSGASNTQIIACIVEQTGNGGNTSGAGTGGDGGNGVTIQSGALDTAVMGCTFTNMGTGGTGGTTAGVSGKAVSDAVVTAASLSVVYKNFAKGISNSTKFDLQALGETGVSSPNPPDGVVINPFANIFTT